MAKAVVVTADAMDEAFAARRFYAERDRAVAVRFEDEFEIALNRVGAMPLSMPAHLLGTRRCLFRGFPYMLIFVDLPDIVRVIAVSHVRQEPGYWRKRR